MATYAKILLSGSTNGKGIKVTGTSSAADVTIHTAVSGTTNLDEVYLWAQNNDADGEPRTLTVAFGGETDPDELIVLTIPCKVGLVPIVLGQPLQNSLVIGAWADEANDVVIYGYVHRRT
jgi:hypothetical protein